MLFKRSFLMLLFIAASFSFISCSDDDDEVVIAPTGSLAIEDQTLDDNNLTVANVVVSNDGWVVVYKDNGTGAPGAEIVGYQQVEAGTHTDFTVALDESVQVEDEEMLWVALHNDDGDGTFEWDGTAGADAPILSGTVPVVAVVEVTLPPTGSLSVSDQELTNNVITVGTVVLDRDGYVVVHADNGSGAPVVPDIISEPVYLEAGTYENVEVPLTDEANIESGDTVWVMLHTDTGTEEQYEFDGQSGLDAPITDENGEIVMESLTITSVTMVDFTGTISIDDQALVNNTISVGTIELDQPGWVVVHADNNGAPMVPDIISEPVYLEAGTHSDIEVSFKDTANLTAGDKIWIMLHDDTGAEGVYEFNGVNGIDLPILDTSGNVVVTSITISE